MAIEKKIPSPSEITGEAKKFTPEEVQESFLKSQLKMLEEKETNLAKQLSDKYGKGSLDTETGEFTPVE